MKTESTIDIVYNIAKPICDKLGYYLVEVNYKKEFTGMVLSLIIDKPEGVNLNDCETLSKALDEPLDKVDISNGQPYNLNVSSYGLDRSLKTDYDFEKFENKEIIIKFFVPFEGKKEIQAILLSHTSNLIKVSFEGKINEFNLKDIAVIKPFIKF